MNKVLEKPPEGYQRTNHISFVRCSKTALLALCQKWHSATKENYGNPVWVRVPTIE